MPPVSECNPYAPETIERPYPFYAAMHREARIHQVLGMGFFIASRYEGLQFVLTHTELFSSKTVLECGRNRHKKCSTSGLKGGCRSRRY